MDLPNSHEDWEHHVSAFLPEMNSCEEEFFSSQELLVGGGGQTATTAASAQSPISAANAPSLSPSGGSGTGAQTGALSPGAMSQTSNAPAPGSCCENGRPIMTDPVSGQTVCSCQYDSARLALSGYSRIPSAGVGVYGTPYPSTDQNPYPSIGVDSSAFYSPLSNPYGLKESGPATDMSAWTSAGLQPTTGYYPYDPTLAAYGYGAGYDLAARRKNATRESTATLKAWLNEHKKNPYPTKGEKIMLAIITKMTLTQVSTWFANARRRLKKENKMTWEPKNKTDDDDDAMVSDEDKDKDDMDSDKNRDHKDSLHHVKSEHEKDDDDDDLTDDDRKPENLGLISGHGHSISHHPHSHHPAYQHHQHHNMLTGYPGIKEEISGGPKNQTSSDCGVPIPATKPKIWSLADTAACKTPPPTGLQHHLLGHHQSQQHQMHQLQQTSAHHNANHNSSQGQQGWMGNYHQQTHQHQQLSSSNNSNSSSTLHAHQNGGNGTTVGMMNMSAHMNMGAGMNQQQHHNNSQQAPSPHHQQQHHRQQQLNSNPNGNQQMMMNTFGNSAYSRYGGFLGATTNTNTNNSIPATAHQMYNSNNIIGSTGTSPIINPNTPATPTTAMHQLQQHQQMSPQQQHQQQPMGFPEVQTDTPPQTPPDMKLPNVVGNLITGSTTPTTGTCYNSNNNNNTITNNNNSNLVNNNNTNTASNNMNGGGYVGESSPSSNGSYVGNFTRIQDQQMIDSPHQDSSVAAFKPFFKSQQISNGFVSPV